MTLRKLDFEKDKYFECGGRKFYVHDTLSFVRWREMQRINLEFGYSASFIDIYNNLDKAVQEFNKHQYFNMAVIINNIQSGIIRLDKKDDPAQRICALFINEEGEDLTTINDGIIKSKIDCWNKELDALPFFYLASSLVKGWMSAYEKIFQSGLTKIEEEENQSEKKEKPE